MAASKSWGRSSCDETDLVPLRFGNLDMSYVVGGFCFSSGALTLMSCAFPLTILFSSTKVLGHVFDAKGPALV